MKKINYIRAVRVLVREDVRADDGEKLKWIKIVLAL